MGKGEEPIADAWGLDDLAPLRTRLRREYLAEVITYKVDKNGDVGEEICREDYVFCGASSTLGPPNTRVRLKNRMDNSELFSLNAGIELDDRTGRPREHDGFCYRIAPEDLRLLRICCGRDDLNHTKPTTPNSPPAKESVANGASSGITYGGIPVDQLQDRLSQKVSIDHFDIVVTEPNGWFIERRNAHDAPWMPSCFFPLSLSHSALEFFVYELARLRQRRATVTKPFEGIALVMMVDGARVQIAKIAVGFSEHLNKEGAAR